jgi:hypothetical protein
MRDFVSADLRTSLSQVEVHERLASLLPHFSFRMGDSDANGLYVSGVDEEQAQLKVWLGEDPATLTLSTRGWRVGVTNRDEAKRMLWEQLTRKVLPALGELVRISECD